MSDHQVTMFLLFALALAGAAIGWLAGPWSPISSGPSGDGGQVEWSASKPVTHWPHLTPAGLGSPSAAGEGRTGLIDWGWEWIASPPGQAEIGLGRAG